MHRRMFLKTLGVAAPAAAAVGTLSAFATSGKKQVVRIVEFDAAGVRKGVVELEKVESLRRSGRSNYRPSNLK